MFLFPKIHEFPPFYTKQPNATILENQLNEWCSIILAYCQYYKIYSITPAGSILKRQSESEQPVELFKNAEIDRSVPPDFLKDILHHLIHKLGRASYIDPKKQDAGILVYWRTLDEWAKILHEHVELTGQLGSILTVYELTKLDESASEELRDLDYSLFVRIIEVLVKRGRAQALPADDKPGEIGGVKIV